MVRNYVDAPPEIEKMAKKLIKKFNLSDARTAKIKYIFKYVSSARAIGKAEVGYTKKATGHWSFLTDVDFVIILWANWWVEASVEAQEANLLHQLCHIGVNQNSGVWEEVKHPIECFPEEIVHAGAWHPSLQDLVSLTKKNK